MEYLESDKYKNILNQLGDEYLFKLSVSFPEEIKSNNTTLCYFPEIEYTIRENKLKQFEPIMNTIAQIIPKE